MLQKFIRQHNAAGAVKRQPFGIAEYQVGQIVLFLRKEVQRIFHIGRQFVEQIFQTSFNAGRSQAAVADNFAGSFFDNGAVVGGQGDASFGVNLVMMVSIKRKVFLNALSLRIKLLYCLWYNMGFFGNQWEYLVIY